MLVLGLGHVYGRVLVDALLPLLTVIAEGVSDDYTAALMWDRADPDMLLIQAQFLNPAGGLSALGIHFGAQVEAGTHVQHALVPPVLVYVLLGVWPVTTVARRLMLLAAGVPAALLSLALTTPFLLAGKVETLVQDYAARSAIVRREPLVLTWMLFCEGGGRWLLPLLLGLACVALLATADDDLSSGYS